MKSLNYPKPSGDQMIARDLVEFFRAQGHECYEISEFRARWFWHSPRKILAWFKELLASMWRVYRFKPDLFFTYHVYYKCPDLLNPILSWFWRRPYYIYEASFAPTKARETWKTRPGYYFTKFALARATCIFTDMVDDYETLAKYIPAKRLVHIPPSIDPNFFQPSQNLADRICAKYSLETVGQKIRILCVAMLRADRKSEGVAMMLRALTQLYQDGIRNWELVVAGDGEKRKELESYATDNLPDMVKFLGQVPRSELVGLYSGADFFAFPGIGETFGLVYIEAQACGLPVLALNNGGIPFAVKEGETALLTPVGDIVAYKEALRKLIQNKDLRMKMRSNARPYVEKNHNRAKNYQSFLQRFQNFAPTKP